MFILNFSYRQVFFQKRTGRNKNPHSSLKIQALPKCRLKALKLIPKNLENLKLQDFVGLFLTGYFFYRTLENLTNIAARVKTDVRKKTFEAKKSRN
jgi:hypothetical protein